MNRYPAFRIGSHTSPTFENDVVEALDKINQGPSGQKLLQTIHGLASREKTVTISEAQGGQAPVARPRLTPSQMAKLGPNPTQAKFEEQLLKQATGTSLLATRGTSSEIPWNKQTAEPLVNERGVPIQGAAPDAAFVALAHELVHARHHLAGTMKHGGNVTPDAASASTASGKEELRATGLGKYAGRGEPSENSIRREHGLPQRTRYARSGNW
jgi:hypothetical protein